MLKNSISLMNTQGFFFSAQAVGHDLHHWHLPVRRHHGRGEVMFAETPLSMQEAWDWIGLP